MKTLFLCFFGDSALWDNIMLVPGYPSGYSYVRPFRYRDEWVQPSLLKEMSSPQAQATLTDAQAILCIRFRSDQHKWSVLPIRKVVIRYVDFLSDNQSVYFSMGPLYDFTKVSSLQEICKPIDPSERTEVGEALFFRANLTIPDTEFTKGSSEDAAWGSFADLVGAGADVPLRKEAENALFIRFQGLGREDPVRTGAIHKSWSRGGIHGAILSEGLSYELIFLHRVPKLITKHISLKRSLIKYKAPSGNLELSRSEEHLTGNYQKHVLNVTAFKPSGTWEELVIELPNEVETQGGQIITTSNFQIPLKVKISHWHRFKQKYIWLGLLWFSLLSNVVLGHIMDDETDWSLIALSAIVTLFSALAVYMLQQESSAK